MPKFAFCADDLPAAARFPAWRAELTAFAVVPLDCADDGFSGRVERFQSARGVDFCIVESGPQRLDSLPGATSDVFWLSMVLDGEAALDLGDEAIGIAPGDILYGKRGAAGTLETRTAFRMLNIGIPAEVLKRATLVPLPTRVLRLQAGTGVNAVLGAFLAGIAGSLHRLDDATSFAIEGALVQLAVTSLFDDTGAVALGGLASARASLLKRIWQSIEARLGDSELALADIAAEHRLSVRYIQQLFEENGQSFRAYLRKRRLARCCEDLANPLNVNLSITEICLHRGFGDSASFSRAFREAYDCTPSAYRRQALTERHDSKLRLRGVTMGTA